MLELQVSIPINSDPHSKSFFNNIDIPLKEIKQLPNFNIKTLSAPDRIPCITNQIGRSEMVNPIPISITGLVTHCDGTPLVNADYIVTCSQCYKRIRYFKEKLIQLVNSILRGRIIHLQLSHVAMIALKLDILVSKSESGEIKSSISIPINSNFPITGVVTPSVNTNKIPIGIVIDRSGSMNEAAGSVNKNSGSERECQPYLQSVQVLTETPIRPPL